MADEKQEGQKTIVSFVVGLLIGGLLVWSFSSPTPSEAPDKEGGTTDSAEEQKEDSETKTTDDSAAKSNTDTVTETASLPVGEGKIVVGNQAASAAITLDGATYPIAEGWVGVRDYSNGQLGGLLGVVRFSESQSIVPSQIVLQRSTTSGNEYAVVVFQDNGDREFNLAEDAQIGEVYATFTAQ